MTGFNDIARSNYCGFYLDVQSEALTNPQAISTPSPFERKLSSKSPQAVRTYKQHLKKKVEQNECEQKVLRSMQIGN